MSPQKGGPACGLPKKQKMRDVRRHRVFATLPVTAVLVSADRSIKTVIQVLMEQMHRVTIHYHCMPRSFGIVAPGTTDPICQTSRQYGQTRRFTEVVAS